MEINIYTMSDCSYCTKLKELLNNSNMKYNEFDIHEEENEETFEKLMEISNCDSVPMITVGQHLLAPDINFSTINQAFEVINYILENETN